MPEFVLSVDIGTTSTRAIVSLLEAFHDEMKGVQS